MRPTIVSVSGFSSDVGKTTVLCKLLRLLPGWEAIKVTRGHYRSCGKDPDACCVSPLLGERPLVMSGPAETREPGKDTARFWEASAAMVHWVVATDAQIGEGIKIALSRVEREGVLVEGASFLKHVEADYSIMVASPAIRDIKSSAVRVMPKMNAIYVNRSEPDHSIGEELRVRLLSRGATIADTPVYFERDLPVVFEEIMAIHRSRSFLADAAGLVFSDTAKDPAEFDSRESD
jgi:molybdopterin-guanine dinucleotide biosynthesis protein